MKAADLPTAAPIKVLLINADAKHFVTHRLAQARYLSERGFDICLAAPMLDAESVAALPFKNESDRDWMESLKKYSFALDRGGIGPWRELRAIWALRSIVRKVDPVLVHGATPKGCIYGSFAARGGQSVKGIVSTVTGLGFVFVSSSLKARLLRPLVVLAYRAAFADSRSLAIFQNSDDLALFQNLKIVALKKTERLGGWGVDLGEFRIAPQTTEADGAIRVVFCGRMLRDKGVFELAAAARLCRKERGLKNKPPVEFHFIGDADPSNPASASRDQLKRWHDDGDIVWHGPVKDVRPHLERAHIACLPSKREGIPMALLEAAACGLPLVAADAPGCREIVRDGLTGILTKTDAPVELSRAIQSLADDAGLRARLGRAARLCMETEYSKESIGEKTALFYRQLLNSAVTRS